VVQTKINMPPTSKYNQTPIDETKLDETRFNNLQSIVIRWKIYWTDSIVHFWQNHEICLKMY